MRNPVAPVKVKQCCHHLNAFQKYLEKTEGKKDKVHSPENNKYISK